MTLTDRIRAVAPELTDEQITQIVAMARELEPLRWSNSVSGLWSAGAVGGIYFITQRYSGDFHLSRTRNGNGIHLQVHPTLEAAKAAAEAHRAAQIRWRK